MREPPAQGSAFTWIEMVVVVIFLLCGVALLIPSINRAGPATWRAQCVNNLRQIGLGIQIYHDIRGEICPAYLTDDNTPAGLPRDFAAWPVLLLPYMEQNNLYEQFQINEPISANIVGPPPVDQATARTTPVSTYFCPSRRRELQLTANGMCSVGDYANVSRADAVPGAVDGKAPRTWDAAMLVSRYFNPTGNPVIFDDIEVAPGEWRSMTTFADVTDGLSNTAFIGEKAVRADRLGGHKTDFARTIEPDQQDGTFYFGGLGVTNDLADLRAPGAIAYWSRRMAPEPKSAVVLTRKIGKGDPVNRFGSAHDGIVLFLLGDGSARSVHVAASNTVLQRFGCRNDGKVFDLP